MNIELVVRDDEDSPQSYIFFFDEEGNKFSVGEWQQVDDLGWVCKLNVVPQSMLKVAFSQIEELKKSNEDLKSLRAQQAREIAELERRNNDWPNEEEELHNCNRNSIGSLQTEITDLKAERDALLNTSSDLQVEIELLKAHARRYNIEVFKSQHRLIKEAELEAQETTNALKSIRTIGSLQKQIHETAVVHGWWDPQKTTVYQPNDYGGYDILPVRGQYVQRSFGDLVALMHSELSEALEAFRERSLETWKICSEHGGGPELCPNSNYCKDKQKPEGAFVELADCIIRILDTAEFYGVNMEELVLEKMKYNETREARHGGKKKL